MANVFALILPLIFLLSPGSLWADSEAMPGAYVEASVGGKYYFKMIPDEKNPFNRENGHGILFKVNPKGPDEVVWETDGWYAFNVHIHFKGEYLVRMGDWPRGHQPADEDLGIAFYNKGKLIKKYSTKDLVKDVTVIRPSVSHYSYLKEIKGFVNRYSNIFIITSLDNIEYQFDVATGKIVSEKQLNNEK